MNIQFEINGKKMEMAVDGEQKLLHFIREVLGLTGTKNGCEIGECGACSILLDGKLVKSCLIPVKKIDGRSITTIEGLQGLDGKPNDMQETFLEHGATQCGYCTPGMILAGEALLRENPNPTRQEIRQAISGNLCRCTGYQQIVDAIESTAKKRNGAKPRDLGGKNG